MVRKGVATVAVVAVVAVVLVGAGVLGYMYFPPANQNSSTTRGQPPSVSTTKGNIEISGATLSGTALSLTIQNVGSQAVSISSLQVIQGSGCPTATTTTTSQTRTQFSLPACMAGAIRFLVQSNSTLRPVTAAQFNFTSHPFNSTSFTRTFSRSGNFSRTFPGNFSSFGGFQLAAGQSVTLTYTGTMGSGVASGSQYTILVMGRQAEAQTTILAT